MSGRAVQAFMAALALVAVSGPVSTQAAPIDRSMIVKTAGGCGAGFHRGPRGHCRPNLLAPERACAVGYHLAPDGVCVSNDLPPGRLCARGHHIGRDGRCHPNW